MMEAPGLEIPTELKDIDEAFVQSSFEIATEYLKSCFSYIFKSPEKQISSYSIGTWSHKIKYNQVKKHGTAEDIARMPKSCGRKFLLEDEIVHDAGPGQFAYKGKTWCVPESFQFPPKVNRLNGWRRWLQGAIHVDGTKKWRIKPYWTFRGTDLPSDKLRTELKTKWKPIFMKMMEAPGLEIPTELKDIDEAFVQSSFEIATEYLKSCFSFMFKASEKQVDAYTIGNWSHKICYSEVRKHGTAEDIAKLPPPTARNKRRGEKLKGEKLILEDDIVHDAGPGQFIYQDRAWCIPESFQFPEKINRLEGWRRWLHGAIHVDGAKKWWIKPYRTFRSADLHSEKLRNQFKNEWKPIFTKMMEAPGLEIPTELKDIDEAFVQSSFEIATEYLKSCFSYIFKASEKTINSYRLGTWSLKIKYNQVKKHGTAEDIARLPPPIARNKSRLDSNPGKRGRDMTWHRAEEAPANLKKHRITQEATKADIVWHLP